ncbi:MAG: hypothetical protein ACI9G1_000956, partial [Pirellulaceae bacterium]
FLGKLADAKEEDGSVLDNSVILYGSSNSITHNNDNYPLVVAGGNQLGLKHGRFLKFNHETPLSNLFVTVLNSIGIESPSFADSSGEMTELQQG